MPYKFVASVDTTSFGKTPQELMLALGRLSWATKNTVDEIGDSYQPPNELLLLGYFEGMDIGVSGCLNSFETDGLANRMHSIMTMGRILWDLR
jgi:hypothetical protein